MHNRIREFGLGDWDDVRVFLAVARCGSFSRAAEMLGTTQSTVSRRIQGLEERLGARLFDRHAHGMRPTAAARAVRRRAELMETQALSIERALVGTDKEAEGAVRVTGTESVLSCWLVPRLSAFQQEFPNIRITLVVNHKALSLSAREADIALRFGVPRDPRLIARSLGKLHFGLFVSRDYAAANGLPRSFAELYEHPVVNHESYHETEGADLWRELIDGHANVPMDTNSSISYLHAVRHGLGVGLLPLHLGEAVPELVPVEVDIEFSRELCLLTHEDTDQSARIQALAQYIRSLACDGMDGWFL